MEKIIIFMIGMAFTFLFVFQIVHFTIEEGDSLYRAIFKAETSIFAILSIGFWIFFMVEAINF